MPEVPLVPTGIHGLDVQLGGGVPKGSLVLLLGDSTNALYTFMEQFAASGVARGDRVYWVDLDRPGASVLSGVDRFLEGPPKGEFLVLEAFEPAVAAGAHNGSGPIRRLFPKGVPQEVSRLVAEGGGTEFRMVLTSLTTLLETMPVSECISFLRYLSFITSSSGGVVLTSIVPTAHAPDVVARLKHLAGGVMTMDLERKGFGLYSTLKIEKLFGVPDATKLLLFSESEKGLVLESTRRVF